jgi:predicted flap endonuclease-1-like 5' DNA nuclease
VNLLSKDQAIGGVILAVCVIVAAVYTVTLFYPQWLGTIGLLNANNAVELANAQFWLIAIPVFVAFIAILLIGAWIGYTMATTPPPKPIEEITTEIEEKKEEAPATPVPPSEEAKPTEELTVNPIPPDTTAETPKPKENQQDAQPEIETSSKPAKEKLRGSKIIDVEGIGPVYAKKLNENNIYTTTDLLEAGATPDKRKELSQKTEISDQLLLRWINMADLFRIKGVGEEYSDLLEASGVDTVVELSKRIPENLHAKMLQVNADKNLVRRPPALSEVKQWIQEAKTLPRRIHY